MTVATGDTVRADVIGDWNGSVEVVQSYQFKLATGGPLADALALDDLADIFEDIWLLAKLLYNTLMTVRRLKARLVPSGVLLGEHIFSPVLVGLQASDISSTTVTAPLSFLSTVPRVILRKSYGPIAENQVDPAGELGAAPLAQLTLISALMLADMVEVNGTWEYGFYSPKTLGFVRPVAAVFSSAPGTMARRRLGRGS